ncbi:hypothetical protein ABZ725_51545 [Streptomyces sp. NPDC006872]|uniref:hypothetical protein n=1 Tax=Streptomyces sp. NPDC006872 TaxID=3155720 RepID=UPI0033F0087C
MAADEEPSRTAGGCVLAVLAGAAAAALFAVDEALGVLTLVTVGWVAVWRSARRRMSDSSATPPPRGADPESDDAARRRLARARGVHDPNGVMCTYHPPREEVTET